MNREAEIESCARDSEQEFVPVQLFLNGKGNGNYCNGEFSFTFNNGKLTHFMWGSIEIPLALPKQEPVAYVSKMTLEALTSNTITSARVWGKENIDPSDEIPLYTSPNNHIVDSNKMINYGKQSGE